MFTVKVTQDDREPFTVKVTSRDIATWERTNKGASLHLLQSDQKLDDVYKITHIAAVRQQLFTGTLTDMRGSCDIDLIDEDDVDEGGPAGDPTQSAV